MPNFTGQLRQNEIFAAIYNMIISQEVFADNIKGMHSKLVREAKTDGGLYGDTKLYYSTDVLSSHKWNADSEANNLLALHRPPAPKCQAIHLTVFRQIPLTVDHYLSKRAFANEYSFSQFNSVMLGWVRDTKDVYESTTYNAYIGTAVGSTASQTVEFDLTTPTTGLTGLEKLRIEGLTIAQSMADLLVELTDISRKYNDYGHLRSYSEDEIKIIWNSKWLNKISKLDLPTIFHQTSLIEKLGDYALPSRYFGTLITSGNIASFSDTTPAAGKPINSATGAYTPGVGNANGTLRSMVEKTVTVSNVNVHIFAGDELPVGATVGASKQFDLGECYFEDEDIICKIMTKLPPFMGSMEVGTTFFNGKSLTENHYLTWGHNEIEYLKNYPMIEVHAD